ncbi:hypothetical protein ACFWA6_16090 [Streptomyces sp. NPDC060020]|uniref:hypothetical protein n=1 Tax=Streptomyces sp. NPDC060020 TaxID=3347038 RepID=UPI003683199E
MDEQVDSALRYASVMVLIELARSRDYRDRADAGRALAGLAERPEAVGPLQELVLDTGDTFVTRVTAQALLRRNDVVGLSIVASALSAADANHCDWICTAIMDVLGIFSSDRDDAMRLSQELARGSDDRVSRGARQLLEILAEIDPVLSPVARG